MQSLNFLMKSAAAILIILQSGLEQTTENSAEMIFSLMKLIALLLLLATLSPALLDVFGFKIRDVFA